MASSNSDSSNYLVKVGGQFLLDGDVQVTTCVKTILSIADNDGNTVYTQILPRGATVSYGPDTAPPPSEECSMFVQIVWNHGSVSVVTTTSQQQTFAPGAIIPDTPFPEALSMMKQSTVFTNDQVSGRRRRGCRGGRGRGRKNTTPSAETNQDSASYASEMARFLGVAAAAFGDLAQRV